MSTKIIDEISKMSVMELAGLIKALEEKFGVSAAAPVAAPVAAVAAESGAADSEKTEFKVVLKETGSEKIKVIKALRAITSLTLKEAKEASEAAPFVVAESASKEDAKKMKESLEAAGAKVELS